MKISWIVGVAALLVPQVALAEPTPERVAACTAALMSKAEPLAPRLRAGDPAAHAQLTPMVESAFAFIADAYLQGVGQARADELLKQARQAQASWPAAQLAPLQDDCLKEGTKLLEGSNFLSRALIRKAAQARIERLRKSKPPVEKASP